MPESALAGLLEHAEQTMDSEVQSAMDEMLKKSPLDASRKNEIDTSLERALSGIARRIDRGVKIELRVGPIPEDNADKSEDHVELPLNAVENIKLVQSKLDKLRFVRLDGEPILNLPQSIDEDNGDS